MREVYPSNGVILDMGVVDDVVVGVIGEKKTIIVTRGCRIGEAVIGTD